MLGYLFNTEEEAITARQACADYLGLPKPNSFTLYWVNYIYSELDNIYYIQYVDGVEMVLGEPITFEITQQEMI